MTLMSLPEWRRGQEVFQDGWHWEVGGCLNSDWRAHGHVDGGVWLTSKLKACEPGGECFPHNRYGDIGRFEDKLTT